MATLNPALCPLITAAAPNLDRIGMTDTDLQKTLEEIEDLPSDEGLIVGAVEPVIEKEAEQ